MNLRGIKMKGGIYSFSILKKKQKVVSLLNLNVDLFKIVICPYINNK